MQVMQAKIPVICISSDDPVSDFTTYFLSWLLGSHSGDYYEFGRTYHLHIHSQISQETNINHAAISAFFVYSSKGGGNMFLRNVGSLSLDYAALYPSA
jgi:hypothetical protein